MAENCFAPDGLVYSGYLNGEEVLGLSGLGQQDYTIGVIDTLFWLNSVDAPGQCAEQLLICIQNRSNNQVLAITSSYIQGRPQDWHMPAPALIIQALVAACEIK